MVGAMEYSSEALGKVIHSLRKQHGMTQEELGKKAGYKTGAGVAVSRIESGQSRPGLQRFEGLATALEVSPDELDTLAAAKDKELDARPRGVAPTSEVRPRGRTQRLGHEVGRRAAIRGRLEDELAQATLRSSEMFLLPFFETASTIADAPDHPGGRLHQESDHGRSPSAAAEAELMLVSDGVFLALGAMAQAAAGGVDIFGAATDAIGSAASTVNAAVGRTVGDFVLNSVAKYGTAGTGKPMRQLHGAPLDNAVLAFVGGGPKAAGGAGVAGGQARIQHLQQRSGTALAVGLLAAGTLAALAVGLHKQREKDEAVAAVLNASRPSFEAFEDLVSQAARLIDDIAIHGGRAVGKWHDQLGAPPLCWGAMTVDQQVRFGDFAELVACQMVVTSLDLSVLMELRGDELEHEMKRVASVLDLAQTRVDSLV
jgi:transcriptional regulator with XRE-family HTH domain